MSELEKRISALEEEISELKGLYNSHVVTTTYPYGMEEVMPNMPPLNPGFNPFYKDYKYLTANKVDN